MTVLRVNAAGCQSCDKVAHNRSENAKSEVVMQTPGRVAAAELAHGRTTRCR